MFAILLVLAVLVYVASWRRSKPKRDVGLRRSRDPHGVIFGRDGQKKTVYSPTAEEGSCLVLGGSGSGKTSAIIIPTLRSVVADGSGTAFAIDISGDIEPTINCANKIVYAPYTSGGAPYNIFAPIDALSDPDEQDEALAQLALSLAPKLKNSSANADFFQDNGRKILEAALIAFYHAGRDFCEICDLILSSSYKALFSQIDASQNPRAIKLINGFAGSSEQNTSGCKGNADDAVKLFATNAKVRSSLRRPKKGETAITPAELETSNIFVCIPDEKLELLSPLVSLIVAQFLSYFSARPKERISTILFVLDEAASFPQDLTPALRKLRKKHCRIITVYQSLADVIKSFGRDTATAMLNNYPYKLILEAVDPETQKYFADLIGKNEQQRSSSTYTGGLLKLAPSSTTESKQRDYKVMPEELGVLGDDLILIYRGGYKRLKKAYYFRRK